MQDSQCTALQCEQQRLGWRQQTRRVDLGHQGEDVCSQASQRENTQHRQISKVHVQCVVLHSHVYTTCSRTDWVPPNLAEDLQLHSIPVPKCFGTFLNGLWSQIREHSPPGELLEWKGKKEQWVFLFPLSENKEDKKNNEQAWTFPGFLL